jgi:hypothetical protein
VCNITKVRLYFAARAAARLLSDCAMKVASIITPLPLFQKLLCLTEGLIIDQHALVHVRGNLLVEDILAL